MATWVTCSNCRIEDAFSEMMILQINSEYIGGKYKAICGQTENKRKNERSIGHNYSPSSSYFELRKGRWAVLKKERWRRQERALKEAGIKKSSFDCTTKCWWKMITAASMAAVRRGSKQDQDPTPFHTVWWPNGVPGTQGYLVVGLSALCSALSGP